MKKEEYYRNNLIEVEVIGQWIKKVIKLIPNHTQKILDIGCGEGTCSALLKKNRNEVWGIEISEKAGALARKKIDKVIIQDAELEWEVPSNYFDVVTMNAYLEHVFDYNFQLQEAKRVLKDHGCLIIVVPNISILERIRLLFGLYPVYADCMEHIRLFTKPFISKILRENGFDPVYWYGWTFVIPKIKLRIKILEKFAPNLCTCLIVKSIKKQIDDASKYNIGIIANPVSGKGKNVYLTKFINTLKPLSNEIFVIDGDFPEIPDKNIHILKIKADDKKESMLIRSIKAILTQLRFSSNLLKISKKIDVVIFFGATEIISILSAKLMRKRTIIITGGSASKSAKKVYRERLFGLGGFVFPRILRILENIGLIFSDRIAVESESAIKFLSLEKYKDKISIIGNMYLDTNKYKVKKDLKSKRDLVGFISRLEEGKGAMHFVKAILLILKERNDLEFLIGGDGRLFNEIRNELENNKELDNKVELTGWIPHDSLPEYLNELKLLVFPSYSEGLPNIVTESMACGAVVLATPVGGIPDLIKDGKTGFIMKDNSPECIAENVIRALEYPNLNEIVKNARELVGKEFTYEATLGRYRKILEEL